jgi:hypothetical protein
MRGRSVARIGILAFGSLIDDPREEIAAIEVAAERMRDIFTPFPVEFARQSRERGGAPTLVPHSKGAPVCAQIIVVETTLQEAKNCLWRRETNKVGQGGSYQHRDNPGVNTLVIKEYALAGMPVVLAATFQATIEPLTATHLAELAIGSAKEKKDGKDGISYLIAAKRNGIVTPLSPAYEAEILRLSDAPTLEAARDKYA